MTQYIIPNREDLFIAAQAAYQGTIEAIAAYRLLAGSMQNPGLVVNDDFLANLHGLYVQLREKVVATFHEDVPKADQVFAAILEALQTTTAAHEISQPMTGAQSPSVQTYSSIPAPQVKGYAGAQVLATKVEAAFSESAPARTYMLEAQDRPEPTKRKGRQPSAIPWGDAIDQINETLTLMDSLPERAGDFVTGASEKLVSMRDWIEKKHYVTGNMASAIENIAAGAEKWLGGRGGSR